MGDRFAVVTVLARDPLEVIGPCAERILQMPGAPEEVVIVDDGSTDEPLAILDESSSHLIIRGAGRGPSAARNLGVAACSAEWLVFLNGDDLPDKDWMTAFRELALRAPKAQYLSVGYTMSVGGIATTVAPANLGAVFSNVTASYLAGTFAIRRSLFDLVGGFDDRLRYMEFEDLAMRIFDTLDGKADAFACDQQSKISRVGGPLELDEAQNPFVLLSSATLLLEKSEGLWRRDSAEFAKQLATIGAACLRCGEISRGIRLFWRAAILKPTSSGHVGLAIASLIPVVRRKRWPIADESTHHPAPLVSVVIPTHGRPLLLAEAVNSVLLQTYQQVEVVIVDDGSPEPIDPPDDPRVRLVRQENAGVAAARNRGALESRGELLFFLDDDDEFSPNRVRNAVTAHAASGADLVVCAQSWLAGDQPLHRRLEGFVQARILDGITPHVGATSIRRSCFVPFDERYLATQDVEWWLRISHRFQVHSINSVDCLIRKHEGVRSTNGMQQRLEWGFQMLDDHESYFSAHPTAASFRWTRLARSALALNDPDTALFAASAACRCKLTRSSGRTLVAAVRSKGASIIGPTRLSMTHQKSALSSRRVRTWRPRVFGPPEVRLIPLSFRSRLASEIASHFGSPWAGYIRAIGTRYGRTPFIEVRSEFGVFLSSRRDHTFLHPAFFETFESAIAARLIEPGMTVVDIGANRGWYTAMAAHLVGEAGQVIAVEPDPRMREALGRTVAHNPWRDRVSIDPRAVSDHSGTQSWTAATEGSLSHLAGPEEESGDTIESVSLDDLLAEHRCGRPGFIKIDVEGAELKVLRSCSFDRFGPELPTIMFEFQPEMLRRSGDEARELLELLWSAGYSILQIRPAAGTLEVLKDHGATPRLELGRNLLAVAAPAVPGLVARILLQTVSSERSPDLN